MTILLWPIIFTVIRINVQATVCAGQILDQNVEEAIILLYDLTIIIAPLFECNKTLAAADGCCCWLTTVMLIQILFAIVRISGGLVVTRPPSHHRSPIEAPLKMAPRGDQFVINYYWCRGELVMGLRGNTWSPASPAQPHLASFTWGQPHDASNQQQPRFKWRLELEKLLSLPCFQKLNKSEEIIVLRTEA